MDLGYSDVLPAAACFLAIAFLYSQYNSRSTEDMTHPLWNLILFRLCEKHIGQGRLIPTPQYRIWVTKTEFQDESDVEPDLEVKVEGQEQPIATENLLDGLEYDEDEEFNEYNISCQTMAQGPKNIMEVIADYVVLVPQVRLQMKTGIAWLDDNPNLADAKKKMLGLLDDPARFLKAMTFIFPTWTAIRAFKVYMPLLLELKRPISRNPATIVEHTTQIDVRLLDAMLQVEQQALCLFKSGKFADQTWAFLIAATGDFWTFRMIVRGKTEGEVTLEFSKKNYAKNWGHKYRYAPDEVEDEENFTEQISIKNEWTDDQRSDDSNSDVEEKTQVFTVEEINHCVATHFRGEAVAQRMTFNNSKEWIACKPIDLSEDIVGCFHWSPALKIGTEASQAALSYISGKLDEFVSQNGVIIT